MELSHHRKAHLGALTGLRFFAAASIVLHHLPGHFGIRREWFEGWPLAHGVSVFFVLSGFILTYQHPSLPTLTDVRSFYIARIARIWPSHVVMLVFVAAWFGMNTGPGTFFLNIFLLQSWMPIASAFFSYNAVSWSISTEVFFYAAFPFLLAGLSRNWPWKLAATFFAGSWMMLLAAALELPDVSVEDSVVVTGLVMVNPPARLFEFCLGMVSTLAFQRSYHWKRLGFVAASVAEAIAVVLLFWSVDIVVDVFGFLVRPFGSPGSLWTYIAVTPGIFTAPLLLLLARGEGIVSRLLERRTIQYLGAVSFAIYLTHQIVLRFFPLDETVGSFYPLRLGTYLMIVLAVSIGLHELVEQPANRFIRLLFASQKSSMSTDATKIG